VLFGELQGINHAQHFVDVAAERQVIDHLMANGAVLVDQEGAAEGNAGGAELDVVGAADFVLDVGDQRVLHLADAAVVDRGVLPREVGELRVDRDADDFDAALLEFVQTVIEGDQFGRADEGEVERIEKDHHVLALVVRELQRLHFIVAKDCGCVEIGRLFADENSHVVSPDEVERFTDWVKR
jgi:hypothetical protein